jgi:hypothetical protein
MHWHNAAFAANMHSLGWALCCAMLCCAVLPDCSSFKCAKCQDSCLLQ